MSGTSLDGVDLVIAEFVESEPDQLRCNLVHNYFLAYSPELRTELLSLHHPIENELERVILAGNQLARLYAEAVNQALTSANIDPAQIAAIGCHGQTLRHRPELGYTLQIGNPALLAELTKVTVIADFRSRDIAAGGQGAPLVPAFHQAVFADKNLHRVVINIGGIANLTSLKPGNPVCGFDTGPGNMLMDAWTEQHLGKTYDESGNWAATGQLIRPLFDTLLSEDFFKLPPPKSTGRDLFNLIWLEKFLQPHLRTEDVQRTLLELTAASIANSVKSECAGVSEIYLCGGGAHNQFLVQRLLEILHPVKISLTDEIGIGVNRVEAAAFAWLARQTLRMAPGNLPEVTGAKEARILGAIYPG